MKIGLVMGAGGVVGTAWLMGGLAGGHDGRRAQAVRRPPGRGREHGRNERLVRSRCAARLPNGVLSTSAVGELVRAVAPSGWGSHPGMWIVACDYDTGRRVVFGREDAPSAELHDAVAASCAIPGTYRSVRIGSRRYVDGGMYSPSNLDVLRDRGLDLVICLNPTSSLHPTHAWNPLERMAKVWRLESGRRLGREARKLRAGGREVVLVQPTGEDLAAMGANLMSLDRERHRRVTDLARRTVAEQLRRPENAERLEDLPRRAGGSGHPGLRLEPRPTAQVSP